MSINRRSGAHRRDQTPLRIVDPRFDLETSPQKIEQRLIAFLRELRWKARGLDPASNNRRNVPAPLLSRCRIVDVPPLSGVYLAHFARREGAARGLSAAAMLEGSSHRRDLRAVNKLIDGLCGHENNPIAH